MVKNISKALAPNTSINVSTFVYLNTWKTQI